MTRSPRAFTVASVVLALAACGGSEDGSGGDGGSTGADGGDLPQAVTVQYDVGYSDQEVVIPVGGTVLWQASGVSHSVTWDSAGPLDSGLFSTSFSLSFQQPGSFTYHCDSHPSDANNRVRVVAQ